MTFQMCLRFYELKAHTYLVQDILLYFVVVDVCKPSRLFASHLLHLGPVEQVVRPPNRLGVGVAILRSFPIVLKLHTN